MITKTDGGPAFPGNQYSDCLTPSGYSEGLSLRDFFAAKALEGICASGPGSEWNNARLAQEAYQLADAMLTARENKS